VSRGSRRRRESKKTKSTLLLRLSLLVVLVVVLLVGSGAASAYAMVQNWLSNLPDYTSPDAFQVAQPTKVYSADGKLLAKLYLQNREIVPISQIATGLSQAIVAVEDERFYEHSGVDPQGIVRAAVTFVTGGNQQGGSTITQQYVRNTVLLDERTHMTLERKVREAFLALQVEKRFTKEQILESYLNTVYFGEGAYGAEAAARTFFAKSAKDLDLPHAALIAGLVQQPSRLDPYTNPKGAVARRNEVLSRMLFNGYISQTQYDQAVASKLVLKRDKTPPDGIYYAPYFVAHVKKVLQRQFSAQTVFNGGLTVQTTLDTRLQADAEKAALHDFNGPKDPMVALVSIDPKTGYVRAMVGGRDFNKGKFNFATQGYRQPGSSFKTFVLVTALEQGMPPSYEIDSNAPVTIPSKPKPWTVDNNEGTGSGMMSLETATHLSVNSVFARVAWALGIKNVAKTAKRMGITTPIPNFPSIALGAVNVTPLEMASAYGTLADKGIYNKPITVAKVLDRDGQTILDVRPSGIEVLKPEIAYAATKVLEGVITQGTASAANIDRPAAGKTGTSQLNRDAWFVGYTPDLVTAVWVGYPTEQTIIVNGSKGFGGSLAAPIWAAFMKKALAGVTVHDFAQQDDPQYDSSAFDIPVSNATQDAKSAPKKSNNNNTVRGTTPVPPTPRPSKTTTP
jgi:1A family penicillin-binding protein